MSLSGRPRSGAGRATNPESGGSHPVAEGSTRRTFFLERRSKSADYSASCRVLCEHQRARLGLPPVLAEYPTSLGPQALARTFSSDQDELRSRCGAGGTACGLEVVTTSPRKPSSRWRKSGRASASARRRASARVVRATLALPGRERHAQGVGRGFGIDPPDGIVHRLGRAAATERDHRSTARQRLDRHDAEVLLTGEEQGATASVVVADDVVGLPAQETDRRAGDRLQPCPLGAFADDRQPAARRRARGHRLVDPLVGHQGGDHEIPVIARPKTGAGSGV